MKKNNYEIYGDFYDNSMYIEYICSKYICKYR